MSLICDVQTVTRDINHPHKKEFKFQPKFKWEGVVLTKLDSKIIAKVYDSFNDISSEVEIAIDIIAKHQLYFIKEGTLFNLYSGDSIETGKETLLFEIKKEPFHITSFNDLIEMHSNLDISKNIKSL